MANGNTGPPTAIVSAVKEYLHITWDSDDNAIAGYIERGMARLNRVAGTELDYTVEDMPRQLLFDYCRYANSQALEVFEENFRGELLDLHLKNRVTEYENQNADTVPDIS